MYTVNFQLYILCASQTRRFSHLSTILPQQHLQVPFLWICCLLQYRPLLAAVLIAVVDFKVDVDKMRAPDASWQFEISNFQVFQEFPKQTYFASILIQDCQKSSVVCL